MSDFDYDSLFSGNINLFTDCNRVPISGSHRSELRHPRAAETVSGWFRPRRGLQDWTKPVAEVPDGWHGEWSRSGTKTPACARRRANV